MKKVVRNVSSLIFLVLLLLQIYVALNPYISFRVYQKLSIVSLEVISLFTFLTLSLSQCKHRLKRRLYIKGTLVVFTILYVGNIIYLLFFDRDFGRNIVFRNYDIFYQSIDAINLHPFAMIGDYLSAYKNGNILFSHLISNIVGNLMIFAPCGILLPTYIKSLNKPLNFIIVISTIIVSSEFLQFYLGVGVCDVDDFILNFIGAILVYSIYKIPFVYQKWKNFLLQ